MIIKAYGHENITAMHDKSIEFTKDKEITKKADCILGVKAGFDNKDIEFLKDKVEVEIIIKAGNMKEIFNAYGSPDLVFNKPNGLIIRKSSIINEKTIAIYANKAPKDMSRKFIEKLRNPEQEIIIEIKSIRRYEKLDFYEGLRFL